jgi:hypothetical protein
MDKSKNPYSPGAGMRPFALAGRDEDIELFDVALGRVTNGLAARSMVFYGLRGVGKTVLLREFYSRAKAAGWIAAFVESDPSKDLRALLGERLEDIVADMAKPGVGKAIVEAIRTVLSFIHAEIDSGGALSLGIDLRGVAGSNAATGRIEGDLGRLVRDLSESTVESGTGVALFVDEAQDLSGADLRAINMIVHRANQEGYRLIVVLTGLPSLPARLADSTSYAERLYRYREMKALTPDAAKVALVVPAEAQGVEWSERAVDAVREATACFSYFVQEYGSAVWDVAACSPIGRADVEAADAAARRALDEGFFRTRWDRATDAQKEYLQAMAEAGEGPVATADIALKLGVAPARLAPRRSELIAKGLIYSTNRGFVDFTVPKMADYIRRQGA